MTYKEYIKLLESSENEMLVENAKDIKKYEKIIITDNIKSSLELFLAHHIVGIAYNESKGNVKTIIASSNTGLIKRFSSNKSTNEEKQTEILNNLSTRGIRTQDKNSVLTWDFLENKFNTIKLTDKRGNRNFKLIYPIIDLHTDKKEMLNSFLNNLLKNSDTILKQITRKITKNNTAK